MNELQKSYLAANLRRLSGHYRSLAEVCRRIDINRQQFNKYLAGTTAPSGHTLKRICDFFGVEEDEIVLPPQRFNAEVLDRQIDRKESTPIDDIFASIMQELPDSQDALKHYTGYYFVYSRSPASPNTLFRALNVIFQKDGYTFEMSLDRFARPERTNPAPGITSKAKGIVLHARDRIYVHSLMAKPPYSPSLTVLYPSNRARLHTLSGIMLSVSSGPGRQAFATRVVYEFLGSAIDRKAAFSRCGIHDLTSPEISPDILSRLENKIEAWEDALCAIAY